MQLAVFGYTWIPRRAIKVTAEALKEVIFKVNAFLQPFLHLCLNGDDRQ